LVNFIPSPYNGFILDTGLIAQLGGNAPDLTRYFGKKDRINHVHFRNARAVVPQGSYFETFIDEGFVDMLQALRALRKTGYSRMIVPDHSPSITGDTNHFGAWGYALGYIKALLHAVAG
jgi:mannonate dehydratase